MTDEVENVFFRATKYISSQYGVQRFTMQCRNGIVNLAICSFYVTHMPVLSLCAVNKRTRYQLSWLIHIATSGLANQMAAKTNKENTVQSESSFNQ
jgi:hypothetical protein